MLGGLLKIEMGTALSLFCANLIGREDDPINVQSRILRQQAQERTATTDLNIIGVRPETEDLAEFRKTKLIHSEPLPDFLPGHDRRGKRHRLDRDITGGGGYRMHPVSWR